MILISSWLSQFRYNILNSIFKTGSNLFKYKSIQHYACVQICIFVSVIFQLIYSLQLLLGVALCWYLFTLRDNGVALWARANTMETFSCLYIKLSLLPVESKRKDSFPKFIDKFYRHACPEYDDKLHQ